MSKQPITCPHCTNDDPKMIEVELSSTGIKYFCRVCSKMFKPEDKK